jgi:hypothetical protein
MEISHGNSLCSYLYFKIEKNVMFFFHLSFVFYQIEEQEGRTDVGWRGWHQWEGEVAGNGG